jgi:hypothetical protein
MRGHDKCISNNATRTWLLQQLNGACLLSVATSGVALYSSNLGTTQQSSCNTLLQQ